MRGEVAFSRASLISDECMNSEEESEGEVEEVEDNIVDDDDGMKGRRGSDDLEERGATLVRKSLRGRR